MNHHFPLIPLIFPIMRYQLWLIRYLNPNIFPLDSDDFKGQWGVPLTVYTHGLCCVPYKFLGITTHKYHYIWLFLAIL